VDDQEDTMKNKKYRSLKMFPSDIILKFKNIVKFNLNKLFKLKKMDDSKNRICHFTNLLDLKSTVLMLTFSNFCYF